MLNGSEGAAAGEVGVGEFYLPAVSRSVGLRAGKDVDLYQGNSARGRSVILRSAPRPGENGVVQIELGLTETSLQARIILLRRSCAGILE